jgi:recombination protein RecA
LRYNPCCQSWQAATRLDKKKGACQNAARRIKGEVKQSSPAPILRLHARDSPLGLPMAVSVATLRFQVETALAGRVAAPFAPQRIRVETAPFGISEVDALTGGLPRAALTEVCGPACSGRSTLLVSALAGRTNQLEACALVDGRDSFDPHSAEAGGVKLEQLLWVRCGNIDQCLRSTDLLLQGGGFGMIAMDLSMLPARTVRYVPLNVWFRFRRAVENTSTIFLLMDQESNAGTCASLVLRLGLEPARWVRPRTQTVSSPSAASSALGSPVSAVNASAVLFGGSDIHVEMVRSRLQSAAGARKYQQFLARHDAGPAASFRTRTQWGYAKEIDKTR